MRSREADANPSMPSIGLLVACAAAVIFAALWIRERRWIAVSRRRLTGMEREEVERRMLEAELQIHAELFSDAPIAAFRLGPARRFVAVNRAAERLFGRPADELRRISLGDCLARAEDGAGVFAVRPDGSRAEIQLVGQPVRDGQGQVREEFCLALEARGSLAGPGGGTNDARTLEALGSFAGGVASDFNDHITTILGHGHVLLARAEEEGRSTRELAEIVHAAERARSVSQQLLAFSRKPLDRSKSFARPEPHERGADAAETAPSSEDRPTRVLVAEDDPQVRLLVTTVLRMDGYEVLSAPDGEEALALCRTLAGELELVLTDVNMPCMTGVELDGELARDFPHVFVSFMSGFVENETFHQDLAGAPRAFLQKPFTPNELREHVARVLEARGSDERSRPAA